MKAQSAIEFVMLVGVVLFFFTIFFITIQENMSDKIKERKNLIVSETALSIQQEIELASESGEGYFREFKIPEEIGNQDYNVTIIEDMVYVRTVDEKYAVALPVLKINGQVVKGSNFITKQNGEIYLNE